MTKEKFVEFGEFLESQGGGAGNGVGYIDTDDQAIGVKGVDVTWEEIYDVLMKNKDTIADYFVIHTRIPSVGKKMSSLCHPFVINPTDKFPSEWTGGVLERTEEFDFYEMYSRHEPTVLTFNGTWRDWKDYYPILAAQGYPLPVFKSPQVSDALIMANMIFSMGVKMLPAIDTGAAIVLQPRYPALVVNRTTIIKYGEWMGIPFYSSSIPAMDDIENIKNVKVGVYCLSPDFVLSDGDLDKYTKYNVNSNNWRGSSTVWTAGKCVVCGKYGSHKKVGIAHVCWNCRKSNDFDEEAFLDAHPEYREGNESIEVEEYTPEGGEAPIVPFVAATTNGGISTDTVGFEFTDSPFLEEVIYSPADCRRPIDDRFSNLYQTSLGEIVWYKGDGQAYMLGDVKDLKKDIIVRLLHRDYFYILYHKPQWGSLWAELKSGNFFVWDALGISGAVSEREEGKIQVYYYRTEDGEPSKTVGVMTSSWEMFASKRNNGIFESWGLVYDYNSLLRWLETRLEIDTGEVLAIDVLYNGKTAGSSEEEFILEYLAVDNVERFGPCEICNEREGTEEINDTVVCKECGSYFGATAIQVYSG